MTTNRLSSLHLERLPLAYCVHLQSPKEKTLMQRYPNTEVRYYAVRRSHTLITWSLLTIPRISSETGPSDKTTSYVWPKLERSTIIGNLITPRYNLCPNGGSLLNRRRMTPSIS